MGNLVVDSNGRAGQFLPLSVAQDFSAGVLPTEVNGIVRVVNVGTSVGHIRYVKHADTDGVAIAAGQREYLMFDTSHNGEVEIVDGTFNIMY